MQPLELAHLPVRMSAFFRIEIATRTSTDGGKSWSNVSFAVGNETYMVGNPTAVAMSDGSVALVYVKHTPRFVQPEEHSDELRGCVCSHRQNFLNACS